MKRTDFFFDLPPELIAQRPSAVRGQDRLMLLGRTSGIVAHHKMAELPGLVDDGTLMVFNNSRVRRARLFGVKETTGREVEFMFLSQAAFGEGSVWNTMVKNAKKQKAGMRYRFPDGSIGTILDDPQNAGTEFRLLKFDFAITEDWFEKNGHIPLPPYIKREDEESDGERYQNVYADQTGSAACPTAGLHFTQEMLETLSKKGVERAFVTLHVGLGTFLPVREDQIEDHKMHQEIYTIEDETARKINRAKKEGRPILAVGTTSVRTLENLYYMGLKLIANPNLAEDQLHVSQWEPYEEVRSDRVTSEESLRALADWMDAHHLEVLHTSTQIIICPGYDYKIVRMLVTNFHQPQSTLLLLVSAFVGGDWRKIYDYALAHDFRFLSYGDSSLLIP